MDKPAKKSLFLSYSREDIEFAKAFASHLNPLVHNGRLEVFFDTESIETGEDWEARINRQLQQADAFIILISRQYFASSYVMQTEMPAMIRRHLDDQIELWPFYVSHYAWEDIELDGFKLSGIQAIGPFDENERLVPLTELNSARQESQYSRAYGEIKHWINRAEEAAILAEQEAKHRAEEEAQQKALEWQRRFQEHAQRKATEREEQKAAQAAEEKQLLNQRYQQQAGGVFCDKLTDGSVGPHMVVLGAGNFQMGSGKDDPDASASEKPRHPVTIDYPLAIGRYPVTFDEFDLFADRTGLKRPDDLGFGRGRRAVINVNWHEASEYAGWLAAETGEPYRLLSEAEWEYACRAGTTTRFYTGDDISSSEALFYSFSGILKQNMGTREHIVTVGSFPANPWNLHDMHGNVLEWVEDLWHRDYVGAPDDGSAWLAGDDDKHRVARGGHWNHFRKHARSAAREHFKSRARRQVTGFRVARDLR